MRFLLLHWEYYKQAAYIVRMDNKTRHLFRRNADIATIIGASTLENVPSDICAQRWLISACGSVQSDQSSLSAWRILASSAVQNAPSENSDQTARMRPI